MQYLVPVACERWDCMAAVCRRRPAVVFLCVFRRPAQYLAQSVPLGSNNHAARASEGFRAHAGVPAELPARSSQMPVAKTAQGAEIGASDTLGTDLRRLARATGRDSPLCSADAAGLS